MGCKRSRVRISPARPVLKYPWTKSFTGFLFFVVSTSSEITPEVKRWQLASWPVILILTVTVASGFPSAPVVPDAVGLVPHFDKIVHFFVFGLLGTLILRTLYRGRRPWLCAVVAIVLTSLIGLGDELHQSTNPVRHFNWFDWVADTAGGIVAVAAFLGWRGYRDLLEMPVRFRRRNRNGGIREGAAAGVPVESLYASAKRR